MKEKGKESRDLREDAKMEVLQLLDAVRHTEQRAFDLLSQVLVNALLNINGYG